MGHSEKFSETCTSNYSSRLDQLCQLLPLERMPNLLAILQAYFNDFQLNFSNPLRSNDIDTKLNNSTGLSKNMHKEMLFT